MQGARGRVGDIGKSSVQPPVNAGVLRRSDIGSELPAEGRPSTSIWQQGQSGRVAPGAAGGQASIIGMVPDGAEWCLSQTGDPEVLMKMWRALTQGVRPQQTLSASQLAHKAICHLSPLAYFSTGDLRPFTSLTAAWEICLMHFDIESAAPGDEDGVVHGPGWARWKSPADWHPPHLRIMQLRSEARGFSSARGQLAPGASIWQPTRPLTRSDRHPGRPNSRK